MVGDGWPATPVAIFRVIVADDTGPLNYTGRVMRPRVYVQWVEGSPGSGPQPVVSSATMQGLMDALWVDEPRIGQRPDSGSERRLLLGGLTADKGAGSRV